MTSTTAIEATAHARPAHYRRNLYLLITDFVFFMIGITLVNGQTVLADFVGRLSGSEVLVGLIGVLFPLGLMLPQLAVAPAVARAKRKRFWVLVPGVPGRTMILLAGIGIALVGAENPALVLVIVFVGYGTFAVCDGISAVGWMDLIGTVLPNDRRGRMFGIGRAISSIIILLFISGLVNYVLDPQTGPSYPNDYALLFLLAWVCFAISIAAFLFVREAGRPRQNAAASPLSLHEYVAYLRRILRQDVHFRRYLAARLALEVAVIAGPFYIRFATESLNIPNEVAVGRAILAGTLGGMVAGPAMGWLSERYGSRLVIWIGCLLIAAQPATALVASAGPAWPIYLAFVMGNMTIASYETGRLNWIIEYADDERRAIYYSLTSAFNVVAVLAPVMGGVIAEQLSYEVLFVVALALAFVGAGLALRLIEPRDRKLPTSAGF